MNLILRTTDLTLTDDLRAAIHALVAKGLQTMGAPPDTEVLVTLRGPARRGSQRHQAEIVASTPDGTLRATGHGLDAEGAVAALQRALRRQASSCRDWHAGGPPATAAAPRLHGHPVSERAMREAARLGEPGGNPNADVTKRPHGYR
jgi:ribosome-associated translation inhibitor RaiA